MLEMRNNNTLFFAFFTVLYSSFMEKIKIFAIIMCHNCLCKRITKLQGGASRTHFLL